MMSSRREHPLSKSLFFLMILSGLGDWRKGSVVKGWAHNQKIMIMSVFTWHLFVLIFTVIWSGTYQTYNSLISLRCQQQYTHLPPCVLDVLKEVYARLQMLSFSASSQLCMVPINNNKKNPHHLTTD